MKEKNPCNDLNSLVEKISENPDPLHSDFTPAVYQLIECGIPAINAIIPLMDHDDYFQRLHAQRVLEGVIMKENGWKPGSGYPLNSNGEQKTKKLLLENGNYQADASQEERIASISRWKQWLKEKTAQDEK